MEKKYIILISLIIIITVIIITILILPSMIVKNKSDDNNSNKNTSESNGIKYSATLQIKSRLEEEKTYNIDVTYDGIIQKINADYVSNPVFYQNNELIYRNSEEDTLYTYKVEQNYAKILTLLKSLNFNKENIIYNQKDRKTYKIDLSEKFAQRLYKNLYIETSINYTPYTEITLSNKKIVDFTYTSIDESTGKGIEIIISYDYLDKDFMVDDSEINRKATQKTYVSEDGSAIAPPDSDRYDEETQVAESNILKLVM